MNIETKFCGVFSSFPDEWAKEGEEDGESPPRAAQRAQAASRGMHYVPYHVSAYQRGCVSRQPSFLDATTGR